MDVAPTIKAVSGAHRELIRGWIALAIALTPALAAISRVSEFTTQDGPAHLYNARIINASLGPNSPFAETFEVSLRPFPNWSGHLGTMALVTTLRPDLAARAMTAFTLVVFAASVFWLRQVVGGPKGLISAAILSALLAMNVTWLMGFTGFLIGSALMPATLALWWAGREWFGPVRTLGLSALLVLGYFCHPISLGLTVVGLGLLAVMTPGLDQVRRGLWTAASLLPMVPLGMEYRALTRSGGRSGADLGPLEESSGRPDRGSRRSAGSTRSRWRPRFIALSIRRAFAAERSRSRLTLWTAVALVVTAGPLRPGDEGRSTRRGLAGPGGLAAAGSVCLGRTRWGSSMGITCTATGRPARPGGARPLARPRRRIGDRAGWRTGLLELRAGRAVGLCLGLRFRLPRPGRQVFEGGAR